MKECIRLLMLIDSMVNITCEVRMQMLQPDALAITITAKVAGEYRSLCRAFSFCLIDNIQDETILIKHFCEEFNSQVQKYQQEAP